MDTFDQLAQDLRQALTHLYDADYRPTQTLWQVLGVDPQQGVGPFQSAMIRAIEELEPQPGLPPGSVFERIYDVLYHRFVLKLTQEETAERLSMSVRNLRRAQRESVHGLARYLWERAELERLSAEDREIEPPTRVASQPDDWLSQVREELASLRESATAAVADVGATMRSALDLARVLTSVQGITLEMKPVPPQLLAKIHSSALKQMLLAAIRVLARDMPRGRIALSVERETRRFRITIKASPCSMDASPDLSLIREILAAHGGSIGLRQDGKTISLLVELPAVSETGDSATVLVLDDNKDLVRTFQLYAGGTRYRVVPGAEEQDIFDTIETTSPDVIVLDVMLPHVDGWELLLQLRAHPATRPIPVIICSVIKEEELAFALGATLYLPKPVLRWQFIEALDQALGQAAAGGPGSHASSESTD